MKCKVQKCKNTGLPCKSNAINGKEVCRVHGGATPGGTASPHFKTGKHSRYTLVKIQDSYAKNLKDETILNLLDEISMIRAMAQQVMDEGGSSMQWKDAQNSYRELYRAMYGKARPDAREIRVRAEELEAVLMQGAKEWQNRLEIMNAFERVRRLVSAEHKHRIDNRMAVTQEQLANHEAALVNIITRHIKDRTLLNAITNDLFALDEELSGKGGDSFSRN